MKVLRKVLKWLVVVVAILFFAVQFKRPARTNPPIDHSQTLEAHAQISPEVSSILARSCNDCHSNRTAWPWYTNVAPVSWFVTEHVDEGRSEMNFSEWGLYNRRRQETRLQAICDEVESGGMPLSSYLPLHPHAKLSAEDKKALCDWAEAERARLR